MAKQVIYHGSYCKIENPKMEVENDKSCKFVILNILLTFPL